MHEPRHVNISEYAHYTRHQQNILPPHTRMLPRPPLPWVRIPRTYCMCVKTLDTRPCQKEHHWHSCRRQWAGSSTPSSETRAHTRCCNQDPGSSTGLQSAATIPAPPWNLKKRDSCWQTTLQPTHSSIDRPVVCIHNPIADLQPTKTETWAHTWCCSPHTWSSTAW